MGRNRVTRPTPTPQLAGSTTNAVAYKVLAQPAQEDERHERAACHWEEGCTREQLIPQAEPTEKETETEKATKTVTGTSTKTMTTGAVDKSSRYPTQMRRFLKKARRRNAGDKNGLAAAAAPGAADHGDQPTQHAPPQEIKRDDNDGAIKTVDPKRSEAIKKGWITRRLNKKARESALIDLTSQRKPSPAAPSPAASEPVASTASPSTEQTYPKDDSYPQDDYPKDGYPRDESHPQDDCPHEQSVASSLFDGMEHRGAPAARLAAAMESDPEPEPEPEPKHVMPWKYRESLATPSVAEPEPAIENARLPSHEIDPDGRLNAGSGLVHSITEHRITQTDGVCDVELYVVTNGEMLYKSGWKPEFEVCWIALSRVVQYWSRFEGGRHGAIESQGFGLARACRKVLAVVGHRKHEYFPLELRVVYQGVSLNRTSWTNGEILQLDHAVDERSIETYWDAASVANPPRDLREEAKELTVTISQVCPDWVF